MEIENLLEAWDANNTANVSVLKLVSDEDFDFKPGKGKTIRSNFTHIVAVRRMWLEEKLPEISKQIAKLDWKLATRDQIENGLEVSHQAMRDLLKAKWAKPGKGNLLKFFAYCVAHEAHHRAQIEIALRLNGKEPDDAVLYKLWDW